MELARLNTLLLIVIVFVNGYIIVMPILPAVLSAGGPSSTQKSTLEAKVRAEAAPRSSSSTSAGTRLIIPSIGLDQEVFSGATAQTLKQGLWHRPGTAEAGRGNMVIVGHRFTYTNPRGAFYHLGRVKAGGTVGVSQAGKNHIYVVRQVKVVSAQAVEIEAPTSQPQLTLYTCTPLWLPKDRLVVIAAPEDSAHE